MSVLWFDDLFVEGMCAWAVRVYLPTLPPAVQMRTFALPEQIDYTFV